MTDFKVYCIKHRVYMKREAKWDKNKQTFIEIWSDEKGCRKRFELYANGD